MAGKDQKAKNDTAEKQLERDPVFQKQMADRAKEVAAAIYGNMMPILKGTVKKRIRVGHVSTGYSIEEVDIDPDERVRAGKLLKETFIDKKVADKRDSGHEKGKGEGAGHEAALKKAEEAVLRKKNRQAIEKAAERAPDAALKRYPATIHDFEKKGPVGNA